MRALQVIRNGELLAVAGTPKAIMLAADITTSIDEPGAVLDVRGMDDLGDDRQSHTNWIEFAPLGRGDRLEVCFLEADSSTSPIQETATDTEQYKAEQAEYAAQLQAEPLVPRALNLIQPNATLMLQVEGHELVVATLEGGREFISCHLLWNRWHPERCRVSLSSFSQAEAIARTGSREWFRGSLCVGECCVITIGA